MESIFVVLFLLSVGVSVGLWQRKQFWREEYLNCLREELEDREIHYRNPKSGSFEYEAEYQLGIHLEEERMRD